MESQPQNPEFRNNPENFAHVQRNYRKMTITEHFPVISLLICLFITLFL